MPSSPIRRGVLWIFLADPQPSVEWAAGFVFLKGIGPEMLDFSQSRQFLRKMPPVAQPGQPSIPGPQFLFRVEKDGVPSFSSLQKPNSVLSITKKGSG